MTIADIEQDIVDRLKDKIEALEIKGYAAKTDNTVLKKAVKQNMLAKLGNALVVYAGSDYDEPTNSSVVAQKRTVWFDIVITMRDLRDHRSAYPYLDAVRIALTGFIPTGCSKMYPNKEDFLDDGAGQWQYGIRFKTVCMNVETPEEEQGVLLKKITVDSPYGQYVCESLIPPIVPEPEG